MQDIFRFLQNRRKPVILAMSRPDAKKNITTLVKAFGENSYLRELANLVLVMVIKQALIPFCIIIIIVHSHHYLCTTL